MRLIYALALLFSAVQVSAQTECIAPDSSLGVATVNYPDFKVVDGPTEDGAAVLMTLPVGTQVIVYGINSAIRAEVGPCDPSETWRGTSSSAFLDLSPEAAVEKLVVWSDIVRSLRKVPARVWITGPGRASITYTDRDGSISQVERTLPWEYKDAVEPGTIISVTAQRLGSEYGTLRMGGYIGISRIRNAEASSAYGVASITFVAEEPSRP